MAQRSRRAGYDNDPLSVLAHRDEDDCAWLFGRECDCRAIGDLSDKMKALGVELTQVGPNTVPFKRDEDWDD